MASMKIETLLSILEDFGLDDDVIVDDGMWAYEIEDVVYDDTIKCVIIKAIDLHPENRY